MWPTHKHIDETSEMNRCPDGTTNNKIIKEMNIEHKQKHENPTEKNASYESLQWFLCRCNNHSSMRSSQFVIFSLLVPLIKRCNGGENKNKNKQTNNLQNFRLLII